MRFMQINMKKAFVACIELNKCLLELDHFVVFVTEPYRNKGKLAGFPSTIGRVTGSSKDMRTGILFGGGAEVIGDETLSNSDCTVGLLQAGDQSIMLASVYLDIKQTASMAPESSRLCQEKTLFLDNWYGQ